MGRLWTELARQMRCCFRFQFQHPHLVPPMEPRSLALGTEVLAEGDVLSLAAKRCQRLKRLGASERTDGLVYRRGNAAFALLHRAQHGVANRDALPQVLLERLRVADYEVGTEAVHRQRSRQAAIQLIER